MTETNWAVSVACLLAFTLYSLLENPIIFALIGAMRVAYVVPASARLSVYKQYLAASLDAIPK